MNNNHCSSENLKTEYNKTHIQYFHDISDEDIKTCCQNWQQTFPKMAVLALVAEAHIDRINDVQAVFKNTGIPLMGAVFPALIYDAEFKSSGLLLICLPEKPLWHLQANIPQEETALNQCLDSIIKTLDPSIDDAANSALFMIFDAMVPNIATILDKFYLELGDSVHYMGVNAGSETFQPMLCLFDSERFEQNGMLLMLFPHHKGAILEHGYQAPQATTLATSTSGNRINTIDWKPAFEVYSERVRQQYGVTITHDNFYQHAVHFPFGIVRADNEVLVRIPVMLDDDGSLFCVGEIPENSVLTLLDAPQAKSLHTVEQLTGKLGNNPVNMLFYCAGRRMHLAGAADNELKDFQQCTGKKLFIGALSLGEIGSSHKGGYPLFHNATLVSLPLEPAADLCH